MKRTLRMLCMGVMAAVSAVSFAQTNVTDKVLNPDAELGMLGWDVTFVNGGQIWNTQTKGEEKAVGYHGYNNLAFENWRNNSAGLTDGSIYQVVKDLPNGTYVFGAYATATRDAWEPSIDAIEGVYLFANEHSIPVATHRVEGMTERWAHAIKFNVATTVEDGTIKFGMKTENSVASFVTMDNVTLYYFGEKDLNTALEEMAKIDMAATIAKVSPYLKSKMNVDTVAFINAAIEAAAGVTAETAAQIDEDLWWGKRQAVVSIAQYAAFAEAIASAKAVAAKEWSDYETTVASLATLNALITEADAMYEAATAEKFELATWGDSLIEAAAVVELDSCYILIDVYNDKIGDMTIGDEIGNYTQLQSDEAWAIMEEVSLALAMVEDGELSAVQAKKDCSVYFASIDRILSNPIDYSQFPITIGRSTTTKIGGYNLLDGAVEQINSSNNLSYAVYTSKTYRFTEPLTKIRFTVKETGNNGKCGNYPFFHVGEFELFDENGDKIELTVENLYSNACHNTLTGGSDGLGLQGLIDGNITTHFHTVYNNSYAVNEYHYIEVTLPEDKDYYGFSFVLTGRSTVSNDINNRSCPAVLDIRYVSDAINELKSVMAEVGGINPIQGTSVGLYNTDVNVYYDALAKAEELANADYVSDSEIAACIKELYAAKATIMENFVLPTPGKEYRILSAVPFVEYQGVTKALTYRLEDNGIYRLWWETACPDSASQVFTFEPMEGAEGEYIYAVKHVATGLYINDYVDADGNVTASNFGLSDVPGEVTLTSLEKGMFTIGQGPLAGYRGDVNTMHAGGHTSGKGEAGAVIKWNTEPLGTSQWYIRELTTLPYTATSTSDETFKTEDINLYEGVNTLVLTADKECAFENFVVRNYLGEIIPAIVNKSGTAAKVELDVVSIASFSFEFTNTEGVTSVSVNASQTTSSGLLISLQDAYDAALALAVVEGNDVGQVSDLSAYNKALETAEDILIAGASDDEIKAAIAAIEAAKAGIVYNMPKADTDYLILLGLDAIRGNHHTDMAVFADAASATLRWTYVSLTNPEYRWRFVDCGQLKNNLPAYYLNNVATECYATRTIESNASVFLVEDSTEARPFNLYFLTNGKVAIADSNWDNGGQSLHPMSHGSGASGNKGAYMITWGRTDVASAMYIVEAEKYISDVIDYITDIEDVEIADEYVAPAVKGIFDLFGRRIETPAATGIYIIDGKKVLVKK